MLDGYQDDTTSIPCFLIGQLGKSNEYQYKKIGEYILEDAIAFKGWTKEGLEFLLRSGDLDENIRRECKKALARLSKESSESIYSKIVRLLQNLYKK